MLIFNRN